MTNIFSFNTDNNEKSIQDKYNEYQEYKNTNDINTVSLTQGDKFIHYQKKIKKRVTKSKKYSQLFSNNGKEGFVQNNNDLTLTSNTNAVLTNTQMSSQNKDELTTLKKEYETTLAEYAKAKSKMDDKTKQYLRRVNGDNMYSGKNIKIGDKILYVTNKGVAKLYPDSRILQGCPGPDVLIPVNIPWNDAYLNPGAIIPTDPPLVIGTPMQNGQNCITTDTNVYVDRPSDLNSYYLGVYTNNDSSPMNFLGERPSGTTITVQNPNFKQPPIAKDSYEYINSSTAVPGWYFSASLINNSSAWGYPVPYPYGSQACSIQATSYISQTFSNVKKGTYNLTLKACGRNCCDNSRNSNPVEIKLNDVTFYTINVPVEKWTTVSTSFTVTNEGTNTIKFIGTFVGDRSTAIQGIKISLSENSSTGSYTLDMCRTQAAIKGYQYYAIQDANQSTGKGYCGVTNDYVGATRLGRSYVTGKMMPLWSSNTALSVDVTKPGTYAKLTSIGTLQVYNADGQSIFSTPAPKNSNYWGCYGDTFNRAIPDMPTNSNAMTYEECMKMTNPSTESACTAAGGSAWNKCSSSGTNYCCGVCNGDATCSSNSGLQWCACNKNSVFGLQYAVYDGGNKGQCFINKSNNEDYNSARKYGKATNCSTDSMGNSMGSGWSNAVYGAQPGFTCFLTLYNSGQIVIYRGQRPDDNQGLIWDSRTAGRQSDANPNWVSSNGKYSSSSSPSDEYNWVANGFNGVQGSDNGMILYPGEFISSPSGSIMLVMQADGNLVLYTSSTDENSVLSKGNFLGGENANALYKFQDKPDATNVGTLAYINFNGQKHEYPIENRVFDNSKFTKYDDLQQTGYQHSIDGKQSESITLDKCEKKCKDDESCGGFTYNKATGTCYYNNKDMSLYATVPNADFSTYIRNKLPEQPIALDTRNISGTQYAKIPVENSKNNYYGLDNYTTVERQQLSQIEDKLNQLSAAIAKSNDKFVTDNNNMFEQSKKNSIGTRDYINEYSETANKIKAEKMMDSNIDGILKDSKIVVLKENYNYAVWSILAIGLVILSMNMRT